MTTTLSENGRLDPCKNAILHAVRTTGIAIIKGYEIDDAFPHPDKPSLAEMHDMITLALVGNIAPPPEPSSQEEQIKEFCDANNLICETGLFDRKLTFKPKGKPPHKRIS